MFRRKKKTSIPLSESGETANADEVICSQSIARALLAAAIMCLLTILAWSALSDLLNRVFPWLVIVQGALVGLAVRRYGRGFDWRFPAIAAPAAAIAAYAGNFYLAAATTALQFNTGTADILANVTGWTFEVFFAETITPADHIFAGYSALLAAFLSRRRLRRAEVHALRNRHERQRKQNQQLLESQE